jgi:hypothetical protein
VSSSWCWPRFSAVPKTAGAAVFLVVAALVGCGSTESSSVKDVVVRGVEQIRASHDAKKLREQLVQTLANLRRDRSATPGKRLAIQGFAATLRGVQAQVDLIENDSGNIEAAVRDAAEADRYWTRGANLLRAAGRALGIRVGNLKGY